MAKKSNSTQQTDTCEVCRHSGLAFLFLRWSAVALEDTGLVTSDASAILTDANLATAMKLPPLKKARYVLRFLRPGYLHIYHEKAPKWRIVECSRSDKLAADPDAKHWETYRITPSGALYPDTHSLFGDKDKDFACINNNATHIFTAMTYRLRDAHKATTIKVAYSTSVWTSDQRKQNIGNGTMETIDVQKILTGARPKDMPRSSMPVDAAWLDSHVAEFAVQEFKHAGLGPTIPFTPHHQQGASVAKRMAELDGKDPATKGKSLVYVLSDPAGTATDLADISKASFSKAVDYSERRRLEVGAAIRVKSLRQQARRVEEVKAQADTRHRLSDLKTDAYGRPLDAAGRHLYTAEAAKALPPRAERPNWRSTGVVSRGTFEAQKLNRGIPKSARWFQLAGDLSMGEVFVPEEDMIDLKTDYATKKIHRLHDHDKLDKFVRDFGTDMDKFMAAVDSHDADRKAWIESEELRANFKTHYDSKVDDAATSHACMSDACNVLVGWGGVSPSLEKSVHALLEAKPSDLTGWALRAVVGNQAGLFSQLTSFWSHMGDWTTSEDNRLDKSYDAFKELLFKEDGTPHFKWIMPAGVGFSFGVMGFLSGAATQLVARAIEKDAPTFARSTQDALAHFDKFVDGVTGKVKSAAVAGEMAIAQKIHALGLSFGSHLEAWMLKKPPARPVYAKVTLTVPEAVEVLLDCRAQGMKFNQTTRKTLAEWQKLPEAVRGKTVELNFLTTDRLLEEAQTMDKVTTNPHRVTVRRRDGVALIAVTTEVLGDMYRKAHRFDDLAKGTATLFDKASSYMGKPLAAALALPAKTSAAAVRGATSWQGMFALGGSWLQWRGLMSNRAKLERLQAELEKIPNLTEAQKAAINNEMLLVQLGMADNYGGIVGGVAETAAIGARVLKLTGVASAATGVLAFAGAYAARANAMQNWEKAEGKAREGDLVFGGAYRFVYASYLVSAAALFSYGLAVLLDWLAKRLIARYVTLEVLVRIGLARAPGFGTAVMVFSFIVEGIVDWFDRTKMEEWVEQCYFGNEPAFKTWKEQEAKFDEALEDLRQKALRVADGSLPAEEQ